jgi:hypothetical protein
VTDQIKLAQFNLSGPLNSPAITVNATDISLIDILASGFGPKLTEKVSIALIDGVVDYSLSGQISNMTELRQNPLQLSLNVRDVTGDVNDIWIQDFNWQQQFKLVNGDISSLASTSSDQNNNLSLALVELGSGITNLSAKSHISLIQQTFSVTLDNVSGDVFGGSFKIPQMQWPPDANKALMLHLDGIDLAEVVALEQQQGITVTGKLSGLLPITIDASKGTKMKDMKVTINEGDLHNISDGKIQVKDNPLVAQLKESRTDLKLAFDALDNLHYHSLKSLVTMTDDGQMLLETKINGVNPDLDNEVNLNLGLDYDLLGLLESLRITDKFEAQLIDSVGKNKIEP